MNKTSAFRIALAADGVSIWSSEIFGQPEPSRVRDFLSRAFSVQEVEGVELRRAASFGRIRYGSVANPRRIWKKLSQVLSGRGDPPLSDAPDGSGARVDAGLVYLDGSAGAPVRISRVGNVLSTWRVRRQSESTLELTHPVLRNRREVVFRLEEELAAILGVETFSASAITGRVSIRFDKSALTPERLARELEKAWPRLLTGHEGPPSRKRIIAASGIVGLSYAGEFLVPALLPWAKASVTLYSFPQVVKAAKELARGQVGVAALYSAGLGLMLFGVGGSPFTASVMASFMQLWPQLTHRKVVRSQRRLFGAQRRRPVWARIAQADGTDVEVNVDELRKGDRIVVRGGDLVPVDGVVEDGFAAIVERAPFSADRIEDRSVGDAVLAGTFIHDGTLTLRVERTGAHTSASYVDSLLPHTLLAGLPSLLEAERVANRNAKPALALSAAAGLLTPDLRASRILIRPDYASGPRLSAQLSAYQALAQAWQQGVLFRNLAALDRLAQADVFVIDDSAGVARRRWRVSGVQTVSGVSAGLIVAYAVAAHGAFRTEHGRALSAYASNGATAEAKAESLLRAAGVTRYRDGGGSEIEIATSGYLDASKLQVPESLRAVLAQSAKAPSRPPGVALAAPAPLRPLWVSRNGEVIGVVSFERRGELVGTQLVAALRSHNERARIVYASRGKKKPEAQALADALGIEFAGVGLSPVAKAELIRGLGGQSVWIGDGSDPQAREPIGASSISVSVAPWSPSRPDLADILLREQGLDALAEVLAVGRAHAQRLARDYRTVYGANLLAVSGVAFPFASGLHAGLLSHLGNGVVYARNARALDRLAAAAVGQRPQLKALPAAVEAQRPLLKS